MQATPTTSADTCEALVLEHLHLVQHVVNQVAVRFPRHVDRGELWNAGALGLVDAARRFDPETGTPFGRYASIRIRGAIIDATRTRDWTTRSLRRGMREVRSAAESFRTEHHREPTTLELADTLGITPERLDRYRTAAMASSLLHLDQRIGANDSDDLTLGDLVEEDAREYLPEEELEYREMTGTLRVAVENLPEVQREVIERSYFGGEYLREIADSLGLTEARVSQIRSEALTAIRAYFHQTFAMAEEVPAGTPGQRARAGFLSAMAEQSTWRSRLDAADRPLQISC